MIRHLVPVLTLLALGGCAIQTEAQINAALARHVGESETDLVREMGVPTRHYDSAGHHFLAYISGHQEIDAPYGPGFGYGGYGPWGGWGWGGYGPGFGYGPGWAFPSRIDSYSCETTFEVAAGRVVGFMRHGNAC
jgi:hypothetical protein